MPEAENSSLHKRLRQLIERRQEGRRTGDPEVGMAFSRGYMPLLMSTERCGQVLVRTSRRAAVSWPATRAPWHLLYRSKRGGRESERAMASEVGSQLRVRSASNSTGHAPVEKARATYRCKLVSYCPTPGKYVKIRDSCWRTKDKDRYATHLEIGADGARRDSIGARR